MKVQNITNNQQNTAFGQDVKTVVVKNLLSGLFDSKTRQLELGKVASLVADGFEIRVGDKFALIQDGQASARQLENIHPHLTSFDEHGVQTTIIRHTAPDGSDLQQISIKEEKGDVEIVALSGIKDRVAQARKALADFRTKTVGFITDLSNVAKNK